MSMFTCMHMSKQSRGMKASAAKSARTASLQASSRWQIAACQGGAGTTPTGGECLVRLVLGESHIASLLAKQQATADTNSHTLLTYLANTYNGGGRKMYPGIERSSHFGKKGSSCPCFVPTRHLELYGVTVISVNSTISLLRSRLTGWEESNWHW